MIATTAISKLESEFLADQLYSSRILKQRIGCRSAGVLGLRATRDKPQNIR